MTTRFAESAVGEALSNGSRVSAMPTPTAPTSPWTTRRPIAASGVVIRDALLPKLLSGDISVNAAEKIAKEAV